MRSYIFHIALVIFTATLPVKAQIAENKLQNGASISVRSNGVLFSDASGQPFFRLAEFQNQSLTGYGTFWMSALNKEGKLLQSAAKGNSAPEFWSGPMDTFTRKSKSPDNWNKVWMARAQDIQKHRNNFSETNYILPQEIAEWPGNSKSGEGLPSILAPYFDWDNDGIYTPVKGDYPAINGNSAAYIMYNDEYGEHAASESLPLKAQVQQITYDVKSGAENAFILEVYVRNMSDENWSDAYFGFYTDLLLGNALDNFAATYADQNLVIGYNGDADDEGMEGYGNSLPYFGAGWLNQNISSSMIFQNSGTYRSYENEEELRNLMEGNLVSGSSKQGGSKFAFPGSSDLKNTGNEISEETEASAPGKRNLLTVTGPFQIPVNGYIKLELAVFGGLSQTPKNSALNHWKAISDYYNYALKVNPIESRFAYFYPNPVFSGDKIYAKLRGLNQFEWELFDINGRVLHQGHSMNNETNINTEGLKGGTYFVRFKNEQINETRKFIVIQ